VIGKDITRFHCLIWPAMLMAADIAVPRCVFGHGFVYNRGEKMSKTIGNIVDPIDLAAFFGADALRYLMLREIAFDRDGDFTVELFVTRYNAELANELGNLFSRTLSMTQRYFDGAVPAWSEGAAAEYARLADGVVRDYRDRMDGLHFDEALGALWRAVQAANKFVEDRKPWAQAKAGDTAALGATLRALLEVLRLSSILCQPFMPVKAAEMRGQLGLERDFAKVSLDDAGAAGSSAWKSVGTSDVLFPKLEVPLADSEQPR
jgi:methionyl-tRNA synthetase